MEKVSIEKATEDLKEIFGAVTFEEFKKGDHLSWFNMENGETLFYIDKQRHERYETIEKLQNYFSDKVIDGGYCAVNPVTLVWTTFQLKKGQPKQE